MNVIHFKKINSTNAYVKENYKTLENFTFVSSEEQTSGKGRLDRKWISPKGENLLFSILIKDKKIIEKFNSLSIGTATLVARFLELLGIKNVSVKWPNDVYVNDNKICGILLEGNVEEYIVIGVGLNVNQINFDGEYRISPTSIRKEVGKEMNLALLEVDLFEFIFKHMNQSSFEKKTLDFIENHNYLLGKEVEINGVKGTVKGINKNFSLLINETEVNSGEINLIK